MDINTKIKCVEREIKRRKKFYPLLVESKKMTQEEADIEIAVMMSVYQTLTQLNGVLNG